MGTFLRMTITPPQSFSSPSPEDADFGRGAAYVEGEIVPVLDARIPLLDTGFTRSDATYDVVAVWNGKFFRLDDHLERFERSCRELRLTPPLGRGEIRDLLSELVRRAGLRESYVEVICTRGVDTAGVRDPREFQNRFYAFAVPYVWLLAREDHETGMHAVITRTVRRISSQAVDPTVKNFHWGDLTRGSTRPSTTTLATPSSSTPRATSPRAPATTSSHSSTASCSRPRPGRSRGSRAARSWSSPMSRACPLRRSRSRSGSSGRRPSSSRHRPPAA
jgi:hypothetical protein